MQPLPKNHHKFRDTGAGGAHSTEQCWYYIGRCHCGVFWCVGGSIRQ